jgi:hypothetical protein
MQGQGQLRSVANKPPSSALPAILQRATRREQRPLHNPPQLARLVVGELPRARQELRKRHSGAWVISTGDALGKKLRGLCRFVVGDGVARERRCDDDLVQRTNLCLELELSPHWQLERLRPTQSMSKAPLCSSAPLLNQPLLLCFHVCERLAFSVTHTLSPPGIFSTVHGCGKRLIGRDW